MTNLVNSLEMIPSIVHKMSLHKHNVEKQVQHLHCALYQGKSSNNSHKYELEQQHAMDVDAYFYKAIDR